MKTKEAVILSCILLGVLLVATQFETPKLVVYKLQYACDPTDGGPASFPFCNTSVSDEDRVTDLISRLTIWEKVEQLVNSAANVSRLGLPAYQWWGEGLHGVAVSPSVHFGGSVPAATSFPLPILTSASYNRTLWNKIAQVRGSVTTISSWISRRRLGLTQIGLHDDLLLF